MQVTPAKAASPWLFELGVALLFHGAILLLWLLRHLIEIVHADDTEETEREGEIPAENLFPS
jgi:hypothetical protein